MGGQAITTCILLGISFLFPSRFKIQLGSVLFSLLSSFFFFLIILLFSLRFLHSFFSLSLNELPLSFSRGEEKREENNVPPLPRW